MTARPDAVPVAVDATDRSIRNRAARWSRQTGSTSRLTAAGFTLAPGRRWASPDERRDVSSRVAASRRRRQRLALSRQSRGRRAGDARRPAVGDRVLGRCGRHQRDTRRASASTGEGYLEMTGYSGRAMRRVARQRALADQLRWSLRPRAPRRRAGTLRTARGTRRVRQKFSGCHCTPRQKGRSGRSIASITPSGAVAETTNPVASAFTDWWWRLFTCTCPRPRAAPRACVHSSDPRLIHTSCAMALFGIATWCVTAPGIDAGMSWTSVPPHATFSTCMPRQIARIGTSRVDGRRHERHLVLVAAGLRRDERLVRRLAEQLAGPRRRRR